MATRFLSLQKLLRKSAPTSHLKPHFHLPYQNPPHHVPLSSPRLPNLFTPTRNSSHGLVNLVLSDSKLRFEIIEIDEPKKKKWQSKKRLKEQRKRERRNRREPNKRDPRRIRPKGKKIKEVRYC